MRAFNHFKTVHVFTGLLMIFSPSCKDECTPNRICSACEVEMNCNCERDASHKCPPNLINGWYNYNECNCQCALGWIGVNCDQRDTNLYVSFRHGTDTLALSAPVKTINYRLAVDSIEVHVPSGNTIDTITITDLIQKCCAEGADYSLLLCGADTTACTKMITKFNDGTMGYAVSGTLTIDSVDNMGEYFIGIISGTFKANLSVSGTGQVYYLREGFFRLPIYPQESYYTVD